MVFACVACIVLSSSMLLRESVSQLWSIFYPCWLSLVLLLWACFIWIIPRLNPRDSLYYTSPVLVIYAMGLLCLQYVYCLNGPDLPSNGSFIVIRPRVEDRSFHLAMEVGQREERSIHMLSLHTIFMHMFPTETLLHAHAPYTNVFTLM